MPSVHILRPDYAPMPPAQAPTQPPASVRPTEPARSGHFLFDMLADTWGAAYAGYQGQRGAFASRRRP